MRLQSAVREETLRQVRELYEASFPKEEKKPFEFMRKKREEGFFDILAAEDEKGGFCGLAIMLLAGGFALLDYLAVSPDCRGGGVGSFVLRELRERYGAEKIVVEIESTLGLGTDGEAGKGRAAGETAERMPGVEAENTGERLRRKAFYLRNGMTEAGILVELMGVEMELLTYGRKLSFEEYYNIYDTIFQGKVGDKVRAVPVCTV